jgi:hypothetical protein
MLKRFLLLMVAATSFSSLWARESFDEFAFVGKDYPWFTGPLLAPSGHVVAEGHYNYEPYVFWTPDLDSYDAHWKHRSTPGINNLFLQVVTQFGVLPNVEFAAAPQIVYNERHGQHRWAVSDLPLTLAFQLLYDRVDAWYPAIKLRLTANVPFGKYDNLKEERLRTDISGFGTWYPSAGLVFTRLHHLTGPHYLEWRFFVNYSIGTPVSIRGSSLYGGVPSRHGIKGTRGTVRPGNTFLTIASFEYSLTLNWALALDVQYQHSNKDRFSGFSPPGTKPKGPSSELFSLAPALEYNFSSRVGIIAGPWFTVAGRNAQAFVCYVLAINVNH